MNCLTASLFNHTVESGSDYVVRVQKRSVRVVEERAITPAATAAGVVEDHFVEAAKASSISHPVRRVVIQLPKHAQGKPCTNHKACEETKDQIVLLTSLVDVPAEVLGAVYRLRWSIETFFRFLKHVLGLKRLFSGKSQGAQIQVAMSIIAALLLALACGGLLVERASSPSRCISRGWQTRTKSGRCSSAMRPRDVTPSGLAKAERSL